MAFLGFFGLGEILVDILDVEEGPGYVAAFAGGLEPGCLGGETCGAVKLSDGCLYGGEFIEVIDHFCWGWSVVAARRYVGCDSITGGEGVNLIEGLQARWAIEYEGVGLLISHCVL